MRRGREDGGGPGPVVVENGTGDSTGVIGGSGVRPGSNQLRGTP